MLLGKIVVLGSHSWLCHCTIDKPVLLASMRANDAGMLKINAC